PMGRHDRVDLIVGARQVVMKQQQLLRPGRLGQADRIFDGGVAEGCPLSELCLEKLAVVYQQVGRSRELDGGRMIDAHPRGTLAERDRAVIRKVSQRRATGANSVAIGQPALVRNLPSHHLEALDGSRTLLDPEESPFSA